MVLENEGGGESVYSKSHLNSGLKGTKRGKSTPGGGQGGLNES